MAARAGLEFVPYAEGRRDEGGDGKRSPEEEEAPAVSVGEVAGEDASVLFIRKGGRKEEEGEKYEPWRPPSRDELDAAAADSPTSSRDDTSSQPAGEGSTRAAVTSTSKQPAVSMVPGESARRGTELRWRGLRLSDAVATLSCPRVAIMLGCSRCHTATDPLMVSSSSHVCTTCGKCKQRITCIYRPILMHRYNNVMGYLDLEGAAPYDIILQDTRCLLTCMTCDTTTQQQGGVQAGVEKSVLCRGCHCRLGLTLEAPRYTQLQVRTDIVVNKGSSVVQVVQTQRVKKVKDAAIQEGRPLPELGACKHYKKSYRWLRFPCCGKAYPCDVCHDEKEEHTMEYATRMICGHCAKEQVMSSKPCVACNLAVTLARSAHWEGGKGCRNKVAMSKNDKQKYANSSGKTVAQKKVGEHSGKRKKEPAPASSTGKK